VWNISVSTRASTTGATATCNRCAGAARGRAKGIDCLFENVGGVCLDAALACMNPFGRVALCGMIAGYNGQDIAIHNVRALLVARLEIRGFIVSDHMDVWPQALAELGRAVATGQLKFRESVAQGLAAAPEAFIGLLQGETLASSW